MGTVICKRSADVVPELPLLKIVTRHSDKMSPHSSQRSKSIKSPISFTINGKRPTKSPKATFYRPTKETEVSTLSTVENNVSLEERPCMTDDYVPTPIKPLIVKQRMIAMNMLARTLFIRYLKSGFWLHDLLEEYRESALSTLCQATLFARGKSRSSFETITESENSYVPSPDAADHVSFRQSQELASLNEGTAAIKDLSSIFDTQTMQYLTIALAMQSYLESEVYLYMVDEQWSVRLDDVAIIRYRPAWNPFSSLKTEKTNDAERLAKEFMGIIDAMDVKILEDMVADEEVLYRLHNSLEANPLTAYSICCPEDSNSNTMSLSRVSSKDSSSGRVKSYRRSYSSPSFDKLKWPSQPPLPSHWMIKLHHNEAISAVVKLPSGSAVYAQARPVHEGMGLTGGSRRVVTVLQSIEEQQPQLAKDLCLLLSKLVR